MKVIRCSDAGFDCTHVIRSNTTDEVLQKAASHAREAHGLKHIDKATIKKMKSIMHDD